MYFCLLNMKKELIRTQLQIVKISGIKSSEDFVATISKTYLKYIFQEKNLVESISKQFANALVSNEHFSENQKSYFDKDDLSYEVLLSNAKNNWCFSTKISLEKINSTKCLIFISKLRYLKIIYEMLYATYKCIKLFNILFLFEGNYNIPFEYDEEFFFEGVWVGDMELNFYQMIVEYVKRNEFHMQKNINFLIGLSPVKTV